MLSRKKPECNTCERLLRDFIHHSKFNRQRKENKQKLANDKKQPGRKDACKEIKEMQK